MRAARLPADVRDIGVLGGEIAPCLYRRRAEDSRRFDVVRRTLCTIVPGVEDISVDLDKRRGTIDILIQQDGTLRRRAHA
jgi:hypothetical protein